MGQYQFYVMEHDITNNITQWVQWTFDEAEAHRLCALFRERNIIYRTEDEEWPDCEYYVKPV